MSAEATILTDSDFRTHLAQSSGVLMFFKKLCPNCKALEKMLDKFFVANPDVNYLRIDSEECPEAMKEFGVERVPTLYVLKDGKVLSKKVGLMNVREMTEFYYSA
ncbi:MAG: thioredoxin family protein [Chloroflexota bacterium]